MSLNRTSLTSKAPYMRDPDPKGAHRMAARVWHDEGSVIIRKESLDRMSWEDREFLQRLAACLYGPRKD